MKKMTENQVKAALESAPEWSLVGETIQRTFHFSDFAGAMAFVGQLADAAEERQHHPDILIRYNKVTLTLATHDAGGITDQDFELAKVADGLFGATG